MGRKEPPRLVVIDYLQSICSPSSGRNGQRTQEVDASSRGLKALAMEYEVPVLVLSQLSREVGKRNPPRPMLSDLRESGAIEADADLVAFIYRPEYYRAKNQNEAPRDTWEECELIIDKQRQGPTGTIELGWRPSTVEFASVVFGPGGRQYQSPSDPFA